MDNLTTVVCCLDHVQTWIPSKMVIFCLSLIFALTVMAEDTDTPTPTPSPEPTPTPSPLPTPTPSETPTPTPTPLPPNPHGPIPATITFETWDDPPTTPPEEACKSPNHTLTKSIKNEKDLCQKIPQSEFYFKGYCSPKQMPDLHGVICKDKNCSDCHPYPWILPAECDARRRVDSPFPTKPFTYYCQTAPGGWPIWAFVIMGIGALSVIGTVGYLASVYCFGRKDAYEQIN